MGILLVLGLKGVVGEVNALKAGAASIKSGGNIAEKANSSSGYYQDAKGRWHRPNGQFASNAEVDVQTAPKVKSSHGNSLSDTRTNYGYVLINKDTKDILKFGKTLYPRTRYSKSILEKKNAVMIILESGRKEYIHQWQHGMIKYFYERNGELPPDNLSFY